MKGFYSKVSQVTGLMLCLTVSSAVLAQAAMDAGGNVVDPAAPTTATSAPVDTMSKGDIKQQRKQQKKDEAAVRAEARATKATAKSKEANDKALQAQEKAGQVTQTPRASAPDTTAPPQ